MRNVIVLIGLCFVSIALSAVTQAQDKVKIGMLLPLTGNYAAGGVDNRQGIETALAVSKTNAPFELIYSDSKAEATLGINEFRKLLGSDNVLAVFVMRGSVGMAVNPISQLSKVPLLGAVGNKDFAATNKYAFQLWSKSDEEGAFLAKRLKDRKYKRVAMLTVQDDWQSAVSDTFRTDFPGKNTQIVYDQEVMPTDTDFRTLLLQIKSSEPDVIFANLGLSQMGAFFRQSKELNITGDKYANFWVAKKDSIESAGLAAIDGVKFIEMNTSLPTLQKVITEKFAGTPSGATLSAYATTLLLQQVINKNPYIKTREELYAELLKQTEIHTPDGPIPIRDRCVKFPLVEKVLLNGKVEVLH